MRATLTSLSLSRLTASRSNHRLELSLECLRNGLMPSPVSVTSVTIALWFGIRTLGRRALVR
jgi:hypothetical protein